MGIEPRAERQVCDVGGPSVTDTATEAWAFPPEPESTGRARRQVQSLLEERALDGVATTAALLVSELATNVVLHARTDFEVRVSITGGVVRIEVHDRSARPPIVRNFTAEASSGRGMLLVKELADSWGTDPDLDGTGKTVWVELPSEPAVATISPIFDMDSMEEL